MKEASSQWAGMGDMVRVEIFITLWCGIDTGLSN